MPQEIERKFLVKGEYKSQAYAQNRIIQRARTDGKSTYTRRAGVPYHQGGIRYIRNQPLRMGERDSFGRGRGVDETVRTGHY